MGKQIRWDQSKRLIAGSLVVLVSRADSSIRRVATVAARTLANLDKDPPEIDLFFARAEDVDFDCSKEWIMIEDRSGFYEASRHTMVTLQRMMKESFPLSEYLVDVQTAVKAPIYLENQPQRDLGRLMSEEGAPSQKPCKVDIINDWPTDFSTTLDDSQQTAVQHILTKSLSVVQGPPGTERLLYPCRRSKFYVQTCRREILLS